MQRATSRFSSGRNTLLPSNDNEQKNSNQKQNASSSFSFGKLILVALIVSLSLFAIYYFAFSKPAPTESENTQTVVFEQQYEEPQIIIKEQDPASINQRPQDIEQMLSKLSEMGRIIDRYKMQEEDRKIDVLTPVPTEKEDLSITEEDEYFRERLSHIEDLSGDMKKLMEALLNKDVSDAKTDAAKMEKILNEITGKQVPKKEELLNKKLSRQETVPSDEELQEDPHSRPKRDKYKYRQDHRQQQ